MSGAEKERMGLDLQRDGVELIGKAQKRSRDAGQRGEMASAKLFKIQEENMSKFKVGDRVKFVGCDPRFSGKCGNVVGVINFTLDFVIGVRFDEFIQSANTLDGKCENNHGWWCCGNELELIDEEHRFNVIITSVGDVTTAKLLHGKKVEKEVSVKRYSKDDYSEKEAVKNVCAKLFSEEGPEKEPEPVGINCKAVCIRDNEALCLTRGKIYEFSDGKCVDDDGDFYPIFVGCEITNYSEPLFADNFVKLVDEI